MLHMVRKHYSIWYHHTKHRVATKPLAITTPDRTKRVKALQQAVTAMTFFLTDITSIDYQQLVSNQLS